MVSTGGKMLDLSPRRAVLGSLLGFALMGLTFGPALAQASHGHHRSVAHHAKKKKSKSKGGTKVTVRCASVGVSCKGRPGPAGATGPAGLNGAPGQNGLDGVRTVARITTTGATTTSPEASCSLIPVLTCPLVPLNGASWTEGPSEDDQFYGQVTVSLPSQEGCGFKKPETTVARVEGIVEVDGKIEGITEVKGQEASATQQTIPIIFNLAFATVEESGSPESALLGTGFFMGNGASQPHTLSFFAIDNCVGGVHPVLNSAVIDVFGTQ
jgi:hypothetical protein